MYYVVNYKTQPEHLNVTRTEYIQDVSKRFVQNARRNP